MTAEEEVDREAIHLQETTEEEDNDLAQANLTTEEE